ncbi:MAG: hypothetical protein KGS09_20840, partial [Nitrospirae bacterium]|nr:hypothetical protein [Nitrospirota bacterium]
RDRGSKQHSGIDSLDRSDLWRKQLVARLFAPTTPTLTDLDPDARVPPLRPLLPEWRNWQTQGT